MIRTSQTPQNDLTFAQQKQAKIRNKGIAGAYGASSLVLTAGSIGTLGINAGLKHYTSNISKQDSVELKKAVHEGLHQTGLYDQGVRAYYVKEKQLHPVKMFKALKAHIKNQNPNRVVLENGAKTPKEIIKDVFSFKFGKADRKAINAVREEILSYGPVGEAIDSLVKNSGAKEQAGAVKNGLLGTVSKMALIKEKLGLGTSYLPNTRKIILPSESFQTDAFRKMGQIMSENGKGALKVLQMAAPSLVAVPAYVLMAALLDKTTDENEKPKGFIQNVAHKVKKHAVGLSVASLVPMVAIEGMNDLKGTKIAKDLYKSGNMSKKLLNKVKVHNAASFATCAVSAFAAVAAVKVALNIKDKVQEKYKTKLEAKEAKKATKTETSTFKPEMKKAS